ncbi:carbohydrate esterase family 16 protein [Peniophora sp. CONT]|nr:carbohydrate esterase family 16 protein [Peniophora sp. CONT]
MLRLISVLALAAACHAAHAPGKLDVLVTFGDSYTDVVAVSNNGTQWPVYAAGYANATLYPYARSGAPCSQALTPRPFPAVVDDEIPLYLAEKANNSIRVPPKDTLYTIWIGTNDVGPNTLLTGTNVAGNTTIVDVTACAVDWVSTLYHSGARNFLLQNMLPLDRTPLYSADSYTNRYWLLPRNTTSWNLEMKQLVAAGNAISKLMLKALVPSLPGAHIGYFDSHALFTDILDNPADYLNGTAPLNTTSCVDACVYQLNEPKTDPGVCTVARGSDADSFVWYDELHPSEQSDRIVAREIASVLDGKGSKYATWFS